MQVTVNGKSREVAAATTVATLLESLGLDAARVAVEMNLAIVPKAHFAETAIRDGDAIEIVQFVGGG